MADKEKDQQPLIQENLIPHPIEQEISESYIAYAMSVIVSRALPDTRDGMKPVVRRILYAMYDMGLNHTAKYRKSATVVWEVLGKYHPHGDSSVYDAMVRLAQPFALRYPLVDGQGNFWSIDGDGAAAMRYTEARLTKIASEMLEDIEQDTVDWRDNYDQSRQEPVMLPTKFPNHLCNGTMGIAVGMATNMPPHNLSEVIDACLMLVKNPDATIEDIMEHIKWPDLPTGWMIFDKANILEVYSKGKGGIVVRGKTHIEDVKWGQTAIVIDEIPYQVNKSSLVSKIGELVVDKKLDGVTDIRDESNRNGIRVVITVRRWVDANSLLVKLYKYTELQGNININNVTLVEQGMQPRLLNIKDLLVEFVDYRRKVVYRRSVYLLNKAKDRLHILEGLKRAIDILDDVIEAIRKSKDRTEAKEKLMKKFEFTDVQAEYILQMRLQSLVWLEIQRIIDEIGEKKALIEYLEGIINDPKKLDKVVTDEMAQIKKSYGDERRTEVVEDDMGSLTGKIKDLLKLEDQKKEDVILWIGADTTFRILYQSRINIIPEDTIELVYTHNQDKLVVITDKGELVVQRLKDIWQHIMKNPGANAKELWNLKWDVVFINTTMHDYKELAMMTDKNSLKKIKKDMLLGFKKFPTTIMNLEGNEKIIAVQAVRDGDAIGIISQKGYLSLFPEAQCRPMGKTAWGLKAIDVGDGDAPAALFIHKNEPFILLNSTNAAKMVAIEDLMFGKSQGMWKRNGKIIQVAEIVGKDKITGGLSIMEGAVRIRLTTGEIKNIHSDKILLDMPEAELEKIVTGTIDCIYRPWEEKAENKAYKEERKAEIKADKKLMAEEESEEE
jgi:DNA gyrase subunit A